MCVPCAHRHRQHHRRNQRAVWQRVVFEVTKTDHSRYSLDAGNSHSIMKFVVLLCLAACLAAAVEAADPLCSSGVKHPDQYNPSCCAITCGASCGAA
jgi:hypothetical protein